MGTEDRKSNVSTVPAPSDTPDTEPADPPTPVPSTHSVEVSVQMESSVEPTAAKLTTSTPPTADLYTTARSTTSTNPVMLEGDSATTQQSMTKPEVANAGVPHTRRFLSIENELDQVNATIRLLEKNLISAQKEARIAWILATVALLAAAAAIAR